MVRRFRDREVLVIAHRGGGNLFSENTLKAFLGVERLGSNHKGWKSCSSA